MKKIFSAILLIVFCFHALAQFSTNRPGGISGGGSFGTNVPGVIGGGGSVSTNAPGVVIPPTVTEYFTNILLHTVANSFTTNRAYFTNNSSAFGNTNLTQLNIRTNISPSRWEWRIGTTIIATNHRSTGTFRTNGTGAGVHGYTRYEPTAASQLQLDALGVIRDPTNFATVNNLGGGSGEVSLAQLAAATNAATLTASINATNGVVSGLAAGSCVINAILTTNLIASQFQLGQTYYSSNLVFFGSSISAINGTYEYDATQKFYTNAPASYVGYDAALKYYVSDVGNSDIFTNATGLAGTWFLNTGAGTPPTSAWSGTSNFIAGRVSIPSTFLATNTGIVYIDANYGNDWNWVRGREDLPMRTLEMFERVQLENDIVKLGSGNYTNNAIMLKSGVKIIGSGINKTTIYPAAGGGATIVLSNRCEISDLAIFNSVRVNGGGSNVIKNLKIFDQSDGFYVEDALYVRVENCDMFSQWDCIANFSTTPATIIDVVGCIMETDGSANADARAILQAGEGRINVLGGRVKVRNAGAVTTTAVCQTTGGFGGSVYFSGTYFDITNGVIGVNLGSGTVYNNNAIQILTTSTAPVLGEQGASIFSNGTNLCVVLRRSDGVLSTNKVTTTAWP